MKVYKFYSSRWAYEALVRQRLKVTTLEDINDPFEFGAVAASDKDQRRVLNRLRKKIMKGKGIISFSTSWESPVLWSHYADSHRGIALGFDVPDSILTKIDYRHDRPLLDDYISSDQSLDFEIAPALISIKAAEWGYEDEVRLFLKLSEADRVSGLYFADFDDNLKLSEIVIGENYKSTGKNVWQQALEDSGVKVVTARMAFNTFRMTPQRNKNLWKTL